MSHNFMMRKLSKEKKQTKHIHDVLDRFSRFPMVNKATKRLHHPRFTTRRPHTYF